jgi:hypothetical protein
MSRRGPPDPAMSCAGNYTNVVTRQVQQRPHMKKKRELQCCWSVRPARGELALAGLTARSAGALTELVLQEEKVNSTTFNHKIRYWTPTNYRYRLIYPLRGFWSGFYLHGGVLKWFLLTWRHIIDFYYHHVQLFTHNPKHLLSLQKSPSSSSTSISLPLILSDRRNLTRSVPPLHSRPGGERAGEQAKVATSSGRESAWAPC